MGKRFRLTALLLVLVMALGLGGCSSSNDSGSGESKSSSTDTASAGAPGISIEDIDWSVDSAIIDGERTLSLNYTNNTPCPIVAFGIDFKGRDDLTDEELDEYYASLSESFSWAQGKKNLKKLKKKDISATAETFCFTTTGEKATPSSVKLYGGYSGITEDQYSVLEPDIAGIMYVFDDKLYSYYYDFVSKEYTQAQETYDLNYWPSGDIGDAIPKLDAEYVACKYDYDSSCSFIALDATMDMFNTYVKACQDNGFTVEADKTTTIYSADNEEGYHIYIWYDSTEQGLEVDVTAPTDN